MIRTPANTIRVYEHAILRVGSKQGGSCFTQNHLEQLVQLEARHGQKYFSLVQRGVRFKQYVGAIGLGNLTIEILPKLESEEEGWQKVLLDLLKINQFGSWEGISEANLGLHPSSMLDIYVQIFLQAIEKALLRGLSKAYRTEELNGRFLQGRLLVARQIQHNHIRKDRFFVNRQDYDYDHPFNQMMLAALAVIGSQSLQLQLQQRCQQYISLFHSFGVRLNYAFDFEKIRHQLFEAEDIKVFELCQMILEHAQPDVRSGSFGILALLFDMNALFEGYIYHSLASFRKEGVHVRRQEVRPFWQKQWIRPDIVLDLEGQRFVLDTKWKRLSGSQPSAADLKQVFVYARYFGAQHAILLYPSQNKEDLLGLSYHPTPKEDHPVTCSLLFAEVLSNGRLNRRIGEELLGKVRGL